MKKYLAACLVALCAVASFAATVATDQTAQTVYKGRHGGK